MLFYNVGKETYLEYTHIQHSSKDYSNDKSINGHSLTENNTDQVLGFNPRSFNTSANNA